MPLPITRKMFQVAVVFVADEFHEFGIWQQTHFFCDRPGSGIRLRVIDGDLNLHVPNIFSPETFNDAQRLG